VENRIQCLCGCIVNRSELVKVIVKKKNSTSYLCCPHHPDAVAGKAALRVYECMNCGKVCFANLHATRKIRCDACQNEKHLEECRNLVTKNKKKPKKIEKAKKIDDKNRFNCSEFSTCGQCIKPYFSCNIYDAVRKNEALK